MSKEILLTWIPGHFLSPQHVYSIVNDAIKLSYTPV
jgi:hypothetical protein